MEIANFILEFIKSVLIWPVITFIIIIYFLRKFKEPIYNFINRIVKGHFYGGGFELLESSQQQKEIQIDKNPYKNIKTEKDAEEYFKKNPNDIITLIKLTKLLWDSLFFERAFNLIYGTQILLLEYLALKGTEGDKYKNLYKFYKDFLDRSKYTTTTMADYIGFLKNMNFIILEEDLNESIVKISDYGILFLDYIRRKYPVSYKNRIF